MRRILNVTVKSIRRFGSLEAGLLPLLKTELEFRLQVLDETNANQLQDQNDQLVEMDAITTKARVMSLFNAFNAAMLKTPIQLLQFLQFQLDFPV